MLGQGLFVNYVIFLGGLEVGQKRSFKKEVTKIDVRFCL